MHLQPFRRVLMEPTMEAKLKELNYNPEDTGSHAGVEKLYESAKRAGIKHEKREHVKRFLSDHHSYSLHKPARRHFKSNQTYVKGIVFNGREI